MSLAVGQTTALPASDYRRRARRLRAAYGDDPPRLYAGLRQLSAQADADRPPAPVRRSSIHSNYAKLVAAKLDGPVLRYSQRTTLLTAAQRLGIGRFEANLIIALVQHRADAEEVTASPARALPPWIPTVSAAVLLQGLIVAAAWWIFL